MYIDKSHSKKELILLFNNLGIELNEDLNKSKISKDIESKINDCKKPK